MQDPEHRLRPGAPFEYLSGTDHERLNKAAHALVKLQLGADKYKEWKGTRGFFELIERARIALFNNTVSDSAWL